MAVFYRRYTICCEAFFGKWVARVQFCGRFMQKNRKIHVVNMASGEITLYGYIGTDDEEVDYKSFKNDFEALAAKGAVTLRINSGGGSMIEGLAMFDLIKNSTAQVTGIVEGMAASMAGVLLQACDQRIMTANSRLMIHRASGGVVGDADKMESMSKLLRQEEDKIVAAFVESTKKEEAEVRGWLQSGKDLWLTAKEAKEYSLIDEIAPAATKVKLPKNVSAQEAVAIYNKQLSIETIEDTMKKPILNLLNKFEVSHKLTEESSDADFQNAVEAALTAKADKIKELEGLIANQNKEKITNVLEAAVSAGKIGAENKAAWEKVLEADFEHGKKALDSMSAKVDVNAVINRGNPNPGKTNERDNWTVRDWEMKDPEGLKALRASKPEEYQTMVDNYYGKPTK
jgi:ATP-dependent Clp protease, protease subunit